MMTNFDIRCFLFAFGFSVAITVPVAFFFDIGSTAVGLLAAFLGMLGLSIGALILDE